MHCDSDVSLDSRLVTAILYLNHNWSASDGGQLRLYPFPYAHIDVEPVADRLVLFSSRYLVHRFFFYSENKI